MSVIQSRVDVGSELYAQNRAGMLARIEAWRAIEAKGRQEEESKRERFRKRRQILPRERVHLMLKYKATWVEPDIRPGDVAFEASILGLFVLAYGALALARFRSTLD